MHDQIRSALRRAWLFPVLLVGVLALGFAGRMANVLLDPDEAAVPFPVPVYEIRAVSGTHHASLLNLPIGQPGVPQAPIPVDVDGDLLPDITVGVNLIDAEGLFQNPPDLGDVLAPNIEIDRLPTAPVLGRNGPPLRVEVAFRVVDLQGQQDDTVVRFGYETGDGGSIPMTFKAVLNGLDEFYNPLEAIIDTEGVMLAGIGDVAGLKLASGSSYDGPLSIVGGIDTEGLEADLGLRYDPWPDAVRVTYAADDAGQHITYGHDFAGEVDLTTNATLVTDEGTTTASATVDRLPGSIALDLDMGSDGGSVDWNADSDGRLPDVNVVARHAAAGARPLNARVDIEALPSSMHGEWSVSDEENGPMAASFESSGQGIGAIEAQIVNFDGNPTSIQRWVPSRRQYANFQQGAGPDPERIIAARLERIRDVSFAKDADGVDADVQMGDGEAPLEAHVALAGVAERDIEATSTISPLPGRIDFSLAGSDPEVEPLTMSYDASEAIDVDVDATVRAAGSHAACGTGVTICADLGIRHIPGQMSATIARLDDELRVAFDAVPRAGGAAPDLYADLVTGPDVVPELGMPLVAHGELLGFPAHTRVRMLQPAAGAPERVEFHTCDWDFDAAVPGCVNGTENDAIGELNFNVRNQLVRSSSVPRLRPTTPIYATVASEGAAFEITGRVTDISELQFIKRNGVLGVRTAIGGGADLQFLADVRNFDPNVFADPVPSPPLPTFDLSANVLVTPLPATWDVCFREAGSPLPPVTTDFTAPCEDLDPFAGDPALTDRSPLSAAFRAPTDFSIFSDVALVTHDVPVDPDRGDDSPIDDITVRGHLDVTNIPGEMTAHVLTPEGGAGPMRVLYETVPHSGQQIDVDFGAAMLEGDTVCADPRTPARGYGSLCVEGRIENLPNSVDVTYDETVAEDNLVVDTEGPEKMSFTGLRFSSVNGVLSDPDDEDSPVKPEVLVAEGQVLGIPEDIFGTLVLPGTVDVQTSPNSPLDQVDVSVRNFIAPDPLPQDPPAQRFRFDDPVNTLAAPDQLVTFFQRGDAFRATAHISEVHGFGFTSARDVDGNLLDTNAIRVDFGRNTTIRAYADLEFLSDEDGNDATPETPVNIIGDVTLEQVPAGLNICFRGPKAAAAPPVNPHPFCDVAPDDDQGAFQLVGDPAPPSATEELDVDATVRVASAGGSDVIAGRLRIDNIPRVVQGTFGGGTVDVGGFEANGTTRDGIDLIRFELANADIPNAGYGDDVPWPTPKESTLAALVPLAQSQFLQLAANDSDFHVKGSIGAIEGAGVPGSDLQRVFIDDTPCAKPTTAAEAGFVPPTDYPFFPNNDGSTYTCARVEFEQVGPPGGSPDPLGLEAIIDRGGQHIALREAGIDDLPSFFQMTLADVDELTPDGALRERCGTTAPAPNTTCMAPMVRVDTPGTSTLFGRVELGALADLATLDTIQPRATMATPDASPLVDGSGWSEWGGDATGIRAKVAVLGDDEATRVAVRAGLRLHIPKSLTVYPFQSWSQENRQDQAHFYAASDIRFGYRVNDAAGVVPSLGQLVAFVALPDGMQALLTDGERPGGNPPDDLAGISIPGEVDLGIYLRDHKGNAQQFVQIDGRVSDSLSARARLLGAPGGILGTVEASILDVPAVGPDVAPGQPSFRIRAEIIGEEGQDPNTPPPPPEEEEEKESSCSILLCVETQIRLDRADAHFDFEPNDGRPARLIEAVIRTAGVKNGLQVRGYREIDGSAAPASVAGPGEVDAGVDAGASLTVDPLNIFFHVGIPVIGSFDFVLISDLYAGFQLENTSDFRLRQNLAHFTASSPGQYGADSTITVRMNIYVMHGLAFSVLGFLPFLGGNPVLLGLDFIPLPTPELILPFVDCSNPFGTEVNTLHIGPSERSVVAWPLADPRIITYGTFSGLVDILRAIGAPIFCFFGTDMDLLSGSPGGTGRHPDDPVGTGELPLHPVPGTSGAASGPPPAPPADPPLQPLHVTSGTNAAYCGSHTFSSVTVDAGTTLQPATVAGPTCAAGDVGTLKVAATGDITINGTLNAGIGSSERLELTAENIAVSSTGQIVGDTGRLVLRAAGLLQVDGAIQADDEGDSAAAGAANGGGAGHRGSGGTSGAGGAGGPASGDPSVQPLGSGDDTGLVPTENGTRGAGPGTPGTGGGNVSLYGSTIRIAGTVSADGTGGSSSAVGACATTGADPDDPGDDTPNTGVVGAGGGSGGGIVLVGTVIDVTGGTVRANGGAGGSGNGGGGGGGSAGAVKVIGPIYRGNPVQLVGGGGGASGCPTDVPAGGAGASDGLIRNDSPASSVLPLDGQFWTNGPLTLPYSAAASPSAGGDDFRVQLCAVRRPATDADAPAPGGAPPYGIVMPSNPSTISRCGSGGSGTIVDLGSVEHTNLETSPDGATFTPTLGADGFYALYTVVHESDTDGNDCFDPSDGFTLLGSGSLFDQFHCRAEAIGGSPDVIVARDATPPTFDLATPADVVPSPSVTLSITNVADSFGGQNGLSGLDTLSCSNDGVTFSECGQGDIAWTLAPGPDPHVVTVRATDMAGNAADHTVSFTVDDTPPVASAAADTAPPPGQNGWYHQSPTFTISGIDDPDSDEPPTVQWWFDGGSRHDCAVVAVPGPYSCSVTTSLPGRGLHQFHWQATDSVGNQQTVQTLAPPVQIDGDAPTSVLSTVPTEVDGTNGWFTRRPFVVISAVDQPGASGLGTAAIAYTLDGGAPTPYTGPFLLEPGSRDVCWTVTDLAGNVETPPCRNDVLVDAARPSVSVATTFPVDGDNGWFVTTPTVRVTGTDATPGSGLGPVAGADLAKLCAPRPTFGLFEPRPAGVCVSVDGGPFAPSAGSYEIPEGIHDVTAFAVDASGQRSRIENLGVRVDLSAAEPAIRAVPEDPARDGWYRRAPLVVLRAQDGDQNAGLRRIEWCTGSGCTPTQVSTTYSVPFVPPTGVTTFRYRTIDEAGRVGPIRTEVYRVDPDAPRPQATSSNPSLWIRLLGPSSTQLRWKVTEPTSTKISVQITVYNALGVPVRHLVAATNQAVTPGVTFSGQTAWNGRDDTLTGLVPAGVYYYRVSVVDQAGNTAMSEESDPITIRLT